MPDVVLTKLEAMALLAVIGDLAVLQALVRQGNPMQAVSDALRDSTAVDIFRDAGLGDGDEAVLALAVKLEAARPPPPEAAR